jgi:hypothetical protein
VSHLFVALAISASPPTAPPDRADYLIIFAGDHTPYRPTQAHTFAALVGIETPPGGAPRVAELHSMSWLPETMNVRGLALRPEKGRNVPLDETLAYCLGPNGHVTAWGPYLVRPELAATFRARVAAVEGHFRYKGAAFTSPRNVCDCIRAVEEMARSDRRYIGVFGYGAAAASSAVRTFSPWLVEPHQTHPWVADLAGLGGYPLVWRGHGEYTTRWDQFRAARRW